MTEIGNRITVADTARLAFLKGHDGEPTAPLTVRLEKYISTLKADADSEKHCKHIKLLESELSKLNANPEEAARLERDLEGYLDILYSPPEPVNEEIDCTP